MRTLLIVLLSLFVYESSCAQDILPNQIRHAVVQHVVDGDTVDVIIASWRGTPDYHTTVRINGIDTPEIESVNAKCPQEITKGLAAKAYAQLLMPPGSKVIVRYQGKDKYYRIDADIITADKKDVASQLLAGGYAQRYDGQGPKPDWCK